MFLSSRTTGTATANTNPRDSKRALNAQLQDLLSLALASSTQATYSSAVKQFLNFCMEHGVQPLPADKCTLVYFVVALSLSLSTPTIKVNLSAVGSFTAIRGLRIQLITIPNSRWSFGAHDKLTSTEPHTQGSRLLELYFTDSWTKSDIFTSFISMTNIC